jgi:hypothetical protein
MPRNLSYRASLTLKVGHWFEAHATGWAVALVPLILLLLLAAGMFATFPHVWTR